MKAGIITLIIGLIGILYAYAAYKKTDISLAEIKKEDLVSYYLELALHLIPVPFWAFLGGIIVVLIGIIIIIVSIII